MRVWLGWVETGGRLKWWRGAAQLLVQAGEARYDMGDRGGAKTCFDRAFSLDEGLVVGMDACVVPQCLRIDEAALPAAAGWWRRRRCCYIVLSFRAESEKENGPDLCVVFGAPTCMCVRACVCMWACACIRVAASCGAVGRYARLLVDASVMELSQEEVKTGACVTDEPRRNAIRVQGCCSESLLLATAPRSQGRVSWRKCSRTRTHGCPPARTHARTHVRPERFPSILYWTPPPHAAPPAPMRLRS